jgi:hypothetical protein
MPKIWAGRIDSKIWCQTSFFFQNRLSKKHKLSNALIAPAAVLYNLIVVNAGPE